MECAILKQDSSRGGADAEDGWYLLRKGGLIEGRIHQAGTAVECKGGICHLHDGCERVRLEGPPSRSMLCGAGLEGVSLYVVERTEHNNLHVRQIFRIEHTIGSEFHLMGVSLKPGESVLCVRYGCCFFLLEFFGW